MSSQREIKEYGLFRAIFGPRPDEPIAELIDIIYSYFVTYFQGDESCSSQNSSEIDGKNEDDSNDGSASEKQENLKNEEKDKESSNGEMQRFHSVEKYLVEVTPKPTENEAKVSTPEGELM